MSKASVRLLTAQCPSWFEVSLSNAGALEGIARVAGTVWSKDGVTLVFENFPRPSAREKVPGTRFPARCPERHVQYNKTFCLGLRQLHIIDESSARQWWEQLRQFLVLQSVAELTGVWPPAHALDHGDAGEYHERAMSIARALGIEEEYAAARLNEPSWVTNPKLRFVDKKDRPINGRAVCPRGCRARCMTKGRQARLVVRKDCDHRMQLLELVILERKRRVALAEYWKWVRAEGTVCCGLMRSCELKKDAA